MRLWEASREGEEKVGPFWRKQRPWDTEPGQGHEARDPLQGGDRSASGPEAWRAEAAGEVRRPQNSARGQVGGEPVPTEAAPGARWAAPGLRSEPGTRRGHHGNWFPQPSPRTLLLEAHHFSLGDVFQSVLLELHVDLASNLGPGGPQGPCPGIQELLLLALTALRVTSGLGLPPLQREGRICQPSARSPR